MAAKPPLAVVQPAPSKNAKAARLEALDWLREGFNPATGQFSNGVSDATIAKEVGLEVGVIVALREEWFGVLKEPDELAEMRKQLADASEAVAAIKARFDKLCVSNGWAA